MNLSSSLPQVSTVISSSFCLGHLEMHHDLLVSVERSRDTKITCHEWSSLDEEEVFRPE